MISSDINYLFILMVYRLKGTGICFFIFILYFYFISSIVIFCYSLAIYFSFFIKSVGIAEIHLQ